MKEFQTAIVGVGAVGQEILRILKKKNFPFSSLVMVGRTSREQEIDGETYPVKAIDEMIWERIQIALFAGTEGEKGASTQFGWKAVEKGTFVVDNGDDFRMDPRVPLIIPEVNSGDLIGHPGFIANPNCSTIQMAVALWPLHQKATLKEVVVSTYQAVSGSGREGVEELEIQSRSFVTGEDFSPKTYPHPIFGNVIPQISSLREDFPGYYREEIKMLLETRKIFHAPNLAITATCVRVPVFNGHSEAITARFNRPITPEEAREILKKAPGIQVVDQPEDSKYPLPRDCSGKDPVYVGRIRQSVLGKDALEMWVVSDNLRKGAALNAVQIAEKAIEMGVV